MVDDDSRRNLIVNYLPSNLTPGDFKNMFIPFGDIESCKIVMDKLTGIVYLHYLLDFYLFIYLFIYYYYYLYLFIYL